MGLIEVMVAMMLLLSALIGAMGLFHLAEATLGESRRAIKALAFGESLLASKQATAWPTLLTDDLNADGRPDVLMNDDGVGPDEQAHDGIFTAAWEQDGLRGVWTVEPDGKPSGWTGSLTDAGAVVINVRVRYVSASGLWRELRLATLRANPSYVGMR